MKLTRHNLAEMIGKIVLLPDKDSGARLAGIIAEARDDKGVLAIKVNLIELDSGAELPPRWWNFDATGIESTPTGTLKLGEDSIMLPWRSGDTA